MTRTIMTDTTTSSFKNKLNCVKSCQCISVQRQRKNSLYVLCMYTPARERQRERCRRGDEPSKTREPIHYPFALPRRESFPLLPFSFPPSFALSPSLSLSLSLALSLSLFLTLSQLFFFSPSLLHGPRSDTAGAAGSAASGLAGAAGAAGQGSSYHRYSFCGQSYADVEYLVVVTILIAGYAEQGCAVVTMLSLGVAIPGISMVIKICFAMTTCRISKRRSGG